MAGQKYKKAALGILNKDDPVEREAAERRLNKDCTKADLDVLNKWYGAPSFEALLNLNRSYLQGEVPFTPYHTGRIYTETKPLVAGLLLLHDFGLLTVESQPSLTREEKKDGCECCGHLWVRTQQRAYITFILPQCYGRFPRQVLETFFIKLLVDEQIYVSILTTKHTCDTKGCNCDVRRMESVPEGFHTHFFTKTEKKEDLDTAGDEAQSVERRGMDCAAVLKDLYNYSDVTKSVDPLIISVTAASWEEPDLAELIKGVAIEAGMGKMYAQQAGRVGV